MKKKLVVVGSLNMDLVAKVPRMPAEGETLTGSTFATYPGGKGANQAVAAARLGGDVSMVGRVGRDAFGEQLRSALQEAGAHVDCVLEADGSTGTAVILVTEQGHNSIVVIPGTNSALHPESLDQHSALFAQAGILLAQLEVPLETVARAGAIAAEQKIPFLLDPAPAQALPAEILRHTTWLTPNESETRILMKHFGFDLSEDISGTDAMASIAGRFLSAGVRNVILKLGARGVYLSGKDVEPSFVESFPMEPVDTTAAGDCFNGAFAYALMDGMEPASAARFACAAAAISVTRQGAQPSMPGLDEVQALVKG